MSATFKVNKDGAVNGWYLVSVIQRFERHSSKSRAEHRRCLVWENVLLINAPNASLAFDKAVKIGKSECKQWNIPDPKSPPQRQGIWYFTGVSDLLPICETLEDGSELMWTEYRNITVSRAKSKTVSKSTWQRQFNAWLGKFGSPQQGRKHK